MSTRVLVAGGTGALGGAVVAELVAAKRPVTATYRSEAGRDRGFERGHDPIRASQRGWCAR